MTAFNFGMVYASVVIAVMNYAMLRTGHYVPIGLVIGTLVGTLVVLVLERVLG